MNNKVFEELNTMINQALRKHGRNPDYVIVGRETLSDMQYHPEAFNYMSLGGNDFKVFGIDITKSEKEHELEVAYKS